MSAVVITAHILGHVRKAAEDDNGGCTFIFDSSSEYIEYKIKVHAPQVSCTALHAPRRDWKTSARPSDFITSLERAQVIALLNNIASNRFPGHSIYLSTLHLFSKQLPYEPIVVRRRYTDFLKLHADLKEREGKVPLSPGGGSGGGAGAADEFMLPSKKLLSISRNPFKNFNNRLDDEFVEERKRKLQVCVWVCRSFSSSFASVHAVRVESGVSHFFLSSASVPFFFFNTTTVILRHCAACPFELGNARGLGGATDELPKRRPPFSAHWPWRRAGR
jgi:hypothetical protein